MNYILYLNIFSVLLLYASGACSPLFLEPQGYSRDPFPVCFPSHFLSPSKPTGISLDKAGGVVSTLPNDLTPWHTVLRRLEVESAAFSNSRSGNKPNLTVVFLGGSMLSGHMTRDSINITACCKIHLDKTPGCYRWGDDMLCPQCAYPARFGDWLAVAYPHVTVDIHNLGVGASVSKGALNSLAPRLDAIGKTIDVVFLHYVNNDARGALDEENNVSMGYEDLIRHLLSLGAAVIDLPMHVDFLPAHYQVIQGVLRTHQKVTSYYEVPVLAIEHNNSVLAKTAAPTQQAAVAIPSTCEGHFENIWPLISHPPWMQHQMIADFLRSAWKFQHDAIMCHPNHPVPNHLVPHPNLNPKQQQHHHHHRVVALPPLMPEFNRTAISAHCTDTYSISTPSIMKASSVWVENGSSWSLGEDVKGNGKPGWWINSPQGGTLTFSLRANATHSVIILSYLTSYTRDMGVVEVYVDGDASRAATVNSLRANRRVSLIEFQRLCLPSTTPGSVGSHSILPTCKELNEAQELKEDSNQQKNQKKELLLSDAVNIHNVSIRLLPKKGANRFKIMGIFSC